jgi:hypothetical protein
LTAWEDMKVRRPRERRCAWMGAITALLVVAPLVGVPSDSSGSAGAAPAGCRFPRVTRRVLAVARERAKKAGCELRIKDAAVEQPEIQTIRKQSRPAGHHGRLMTVWLNPLCSGSGAWGPPAGEPFLSRGPTELVSGLYLDGGPHRFRSAPRCESLSGTPGAGSITVTDLATGATSAAQTVSAGQLATIPLPAGTYSVTGLFGNAVINGEQARSFPRTVKIPPGTTVRQDVVLSVP